MAYTRRGLRSGSLHHPDFLAAALVGYELQLYQISGKIAEIERQLGRPAEHDGQEVLSVPEGAPARRQRNMSAAARERIAAAQRKRWASYRKGKAPTAKKAAAEKSAATPVRRMSAAARNRIAAAQKKRWAEVRAKKGKAEK